MVLTITTASRQDVATIAALLEELDRFYGATEFGTIEGRAKQISSLLFRDQPAARVLLAWEDREAAGLAAYTFLWPAAGATQSLYLKELYVAQRYRKHGVGRALMQRLCEIAVEEDCSRVEWTTDRDNPDALRFYDALDYPPNPGKVFYRLEGEVLLRASRDIVE